MSRKINYAEVDCTDLDLLIDGISQGNTEALAQLYHVAGTSVFSYALSVLKNTHDAEDVLHDCFVRIYQSASGYRPNGKPMAWILTIAKNLCMDRLREQNKQKSIQDQDWKQYIDTNPAVTTDDRLILAACMEQLTDDERQIVVLHAVSGFLHREIAQLMGLTLSTVLSKYHRSIKKLKKHLRKENS